MTIEDRVYVAVCAYAAVAVARAPGVLIPGLCWTAFIVTLLIVHWLSDRRTRLRRQRAWQAAARGNPRVTILAPDGEETSRGHQTQPGSG